MRSAPGKKTAVRNPESGAIALVVAAMWLTLFGLAAFAVDVGFQYTSRRGLQAAADAAVRTGMPLLSSSPGQARVAATNMAQANGYSNSGSTHVTVNTPGNQLQVTIEIAQPSFFMKLFGINSRTFRAYSAGEYVTGGGAAIHASAGCGIGVGFTAQGMGALNVTGDIESNGILRFSVGLPGATSGTARSPCVGQPDDPTYVVTGGSGSGGPFPDPFAGTSFASFPACDYGDLINPYSIPFGNWTIGATEDTLLPGVYCSGGGLAVAPVGGSMVINAPNCTFLAVGAIQIGANNGATMSAAPGSSGHNILAYTTYSGAGPAINVGQNNFVLTGSLYAPSGLINSGGSNMTVNGSLVANEINMGTWGSWTINGSGAGATTWQMVQ